MAQHCKTKLYIVAFNVLINGQVKKYGTMQPLPFMNKQNSNQQQQQQPDTYFEAVIHFLATTMLAVEVETVVGTVAGRAFPSLPTIL